MQFTKIALPLAACVALVACGGGGGSGAAPAPAPAPAPAQQGYFIDSGVDGLSYSSSPSGLSGVTSNGGRFDYKTGDTVTFYVGNLQLGTASGASVVTPLVLAGTDDYTDTTATNISRLLQTLDVDGDPENGITISEAVQDAAGELSGEDAEIDFSGASFATAAQELVNSLDSNEPPLVSESDAQNHLHGSVIDTDEDGEINGVDTDDDGDGVEDSSDAFPLDATESLDTDSDGTGNNADTDDDGDGVADSSDAFPLDATESLDTDSDGIGNNADTDDDGDGVADSSDAFPLDPTETVDTDGDGTGNNADTDDDDDGVADTEDDLPLDATETVDTDDDGIGNNADTDDDNDGLLDSEDSLPLDGSNGTKWDQMNWNDGQWK